MHFVYVASPHQILLHLPIILLHFPIKFASFPPKIASSPQQVASFPQQIASFPQKNSHFPITFLLHFAKSKIIHFLTFFSSWKSLRYSSSGGTSVDSLSVSSLAKTALSDWSSSFFKDISIASALNFSHSHSLQSASSAYPPPRSYSAQSPPFSLSSVLSAVGIDFKKYSYIGISGWLHSLGS